ncbi:biotin/lipoyl-containing protein [Intestinibacillus sp. Marseille-P6563]|uniref:biotin/lipoyl-containing protein n=1 Tax=Intestinibacillus sp. Marseille-P6563 TaxID=2364792 RepID=UPI000F06B9EA|nr:biotin/lipoyl-containing protein [Intestinibacillus sp. Marseille-P6563]
MVSRVLVHEGDEVEQNQVLLVIEAMKMETSVVARVDGRVESLLVSENTEVKAGELLAIIK